MKKLKNKKLYSVVVLLTIMANLIVFNRFITPLAGIDRPLNVTVTNSNGQPQANITLGEPIILSWNAIGLPSQLGLSYDGYVSEIYKKINDGSWIFLETLTGRGSKTFEYVPEEVGNHQFKIVERATKMITRFGTFNVNKLVAEEMSNVVNIYNDLIPSPLVNLVTPKDEIFLSKEIKGENYPSMGGYYPSTYGFDFMEDVNINSITCTNGYLGSGSLINTRVDDENYQQLTPSTIPIYRNVFIYTINAEFNFDYGVYGKKYFLTLKMDSSSNVLINLYINDELYSSATNIEIDNLLIEDLSSIKVILNGEQSFDLKIYFLKLEQSEFIDHYYTIEEPSFVPEIDLHKGILKFTGTSKPILNWISHDFDKIPLYGTIEWWWRTENTFNNNAFTLREDDLPILGIKIYLGKFFGYNGTWVDIGSTARNDAWYHIRIDYECSSSGYEGLSPCSWNLYINGRLTSSLNLVPGHGINNLRFAAGQGGMKFAQYIDAVGITGLDDDYKVGNNENEGLLIKCDIDSSLNPDSLEFILDLNKIFPLLECPIIIPFPDQEEETIKQYSIQIVAHEGGMSYYSERHHFIYSNSWYERYDKYDIGTYQDNSWNKDYSAGSTIDIVRGSDHGFYFQGNMLRMYSSGIGIISMNKLEYIDMDHGDALLYSFKVGITTESDNFNTKFLIKEGSDNNFFELLLDTGENHIRLESHGRSNEIPLVLNQLYDIKIVLLKDPRADRMSIYVFVDENLEHYHDIVFSANSLQLSIESVNSIDTEAELFFDDFYFGFVDYENKGPLFSVPVIPFYYLYDPEYENSPYIDGMHMVYRVAGTTRTSTVLSISIGDMNAEFDMIPINFNHDIDIYEVGTNGIDVILFYTFDSYIKDLQISLPGFNSSIIGIDPATIEGLFFDFPGLFATDVGTFEKTFGYLPQDYLDIKNDTHYVRTQLLDSGAGGSKGSFYNIAYAYYDEDYTHSGVIPIEYEGIGDSIEYSITYFNGIHTDLSIEVEWTNAPQHQTVEIDLYQPSGTVYDLISPIPPYTAIQVL